MKKILMVLLLFAITGCASKEVARFDKINVGMTRLEVSEALGLQNRLVGTTIFSDVFVEVWEYKQDLYSPQDEAYWLYYFDGKFVKWDHANQKDWKGEALRIYELRK